MTANLLIAAFATCTGIVIGAMTLDHYHYTPILDYIPADHRLSDGAVTGLEVGQ